MTTDKSMMTIAKILRSKLSWKEYAIAALMIILGCLGVIVSYQSDLVLSFVGSIVAISALVGLVCVFLRAFYGAWLAASYFLGMLALLSVAMMIWSLLFLSLSDKQRQSASSIVDGTRNITVNYPARIPIYGTGSIVTITLTPLLTSTMPLSLSLELSEALQLEALHGSRSISIDEQTPQRALITLDSSTSPQTVTVRIADSLTQVGSFVPWIPQPQGSITIKEDGGANPLIVLSVEVETLARGTLRTFIQSDLGERSPFLLLAATLIAAVGWFFSQRDKRLEAQKEAHKEAEQHAQQELVVLRSLLRAGKVLQAKQKREHLIRSSLTTYLEEELALVDLLLSVVEKRGPYAELTALLDRWPSETAGVLIHLVEGLSEADPVPTDLRRILRLLPQDRLEPTERMRVRDARERCRIEIAQPRVWPEQDAAPRAIPPPVTLKELSIFPALKAEEEPRLFSRQRSVFYTHPLYRQLTRCEIPTLVWGEPGVGRTAMARRLALFHDNAETLGSYHLGMPDHAAIRRALAAQLIRFVCSSPAWLGGLSEEERALIAYCGVSILGTQVVLALITRAETVHQRIPLGEGEAPIDQIKLWSAEAEVQRAIFREDVLRVHGSSRVRDSAWPYVLYQAAQSLEFKHVRVVFDISGPMWRGWIPGMVEEVLLPWFDAGMIPTVFISAHSPDVLGQEDLFRWHELHWQIDNEKSLEKMVKYRYEQLFTGTHALEDYFELEDEKNTLLSEMFIAAKYNPQRLAAQWMSIQSRFPESTKICRTML